MKKEQKKIDVSIEYKQNEKAVKKFVEFIIDYYEEKIQLER
ncbi:hypothetical protein [Sporosalibacterium faouarense]|nr:hypothetical protein [Sporosalibacterium faouarense]